MIDIKLIRENPEVVKSTLKKRGMSLKLLNDVIALDKQWRQLLEKEQRLRHKRNVISKEIGLLKQKKKPVAEKIKKMKKNSEEVKKISAKIRDVNEKLRLSLIKIPNILHPSVPVGKDDTDNKVVRKWGKIPKFSFKPKSHLEILNNLGMIDFESAAKVAGNAFYYLKGDMVLLDLALKRFALQHLKKKGFQIFEPPFMVNKRSYEGMIGDPTDFAEASYKVEGEDLYLIPTAEYPLGSMFSDRIFDKRELPVKVCGVSACFRREVGTHGKYSKGLFRVHQFNKIEQFVFCSPEQSWKMLEELQKNSEQLYQKLGLCYRVVLACSGDTPTKASKMYDIEVWMADGKYRESGSNSNVTDYQARRLNMRFRERPNEPTRFIHTLNNTALATSRTMIAIVEQFQQKDGTVKVPKVLWKYTGFKKLG